MPENKEIDTVIEALKAIRDAAANQYIEQLRSKHPVLFTGGAEAETALRAIISDTIAQAREVTESVTAERVASKLLMAMEEDARSIREDGIPPKLIEMMKTNPIDAALAFNAVAYQGAITVAMTISRGGDPVFSGDCDCEYHTQKRQEKEEFPGHVISKTGIA